MTEQTHSSQRVFLATPARLPLKTSNTRTHRVIRVSADVDARHLHEAAGGAGACVEVAAGGEKSEPASRESSQGQKNKTHVQRARNRSTQRSCNDELGHSFGIPRVQKHAGKNPNVPANSANPANPFQLGADKLVRAMREHT